MFTSSTLLTPTLRRTAPEPSPFTPKTNFNKVALSASPAQQQRQGVSSEKADEIGKAFRHLLKSLRGAKALGIEEKIDSYVHGLQQLQKWRGLITAYLAFFSDKSSSIDNLDKRTLNARLFNIVNSNKPDVARYGDNLNITVPLNELVDSMEEQPNFDVDTLLATWVKLQRNVNRVRRILENKERETTKLLNAKVREAHGAVYGG
jgi:hypothetical protein